MYINERILNCLVKATSTIGSLQYTYELEMQKEKMINLEKLMLRKKDGIDWEVTEIESNDGDKEKNDDIKIVGAQLQATKLARFE